MRDDDLLVVDLAKQPIQIPSVEWDGSWESECGCRWNSQTLAVYPCSEVHREIVEAEARRLQRAFDDAKRGECGGTAADGNPCWLVPHYGPCRSRNQASREADDRGQDAFG